MTPSLCDSPRIASRRGRLTRKLVPSPQNSTKRPHRVANSSVDCPKPSENCGSKPMADRKDEISTLNTLIATLIDSINGYEDAAGHSEAGRFQQIFRDRANERQRAVEELRSEVRRLGGEPEESGSFLGKTHQAFFGLKAAITGRDDKAIINEVERGEDYLKEKFETALDSGKLSGDTRSLVERCYQSVKAGHDQMSQLKHGFEAGTT